MIVPYADRYGNRPEIGDKVTVISQINRGYYCITVGHVLTFMGTDSRHNPGDILKDEETGLIITKVSCLDYTKYEPDLETARKNYIERKEKEKFIEFIRKNCRERCGDQEHGNCKHGVYCIEHIPEEEYKDNDFIFNYMRKLKLRVVSNEL